MSTATTACVGPRREPLRGRDRASAALSLILLLVSLVILYLALLALWSLLLGTGRGAPPSVTFAILATTAVAAAVRPVHQRTGRVARRLLKVGPTTRYDALAAFVRRLATLTSTDDALAEVAAITGVALRARRADLWLTAAGQWYLAASWGDGDGRPGRPEDADAYVGLRHAGDVPGHVLGALSVTTGGGALAPADAQLLDDIASQAVPVVRSVGLTAELEARLSVISRQRDELDAARRRLLTVAEVEQRRLQQDLADGPLRHLRLIAADLPRLRSGAQVLPQLQRHADAAIESLRDLARGVYPPVLRDSGLAAALRSRYRHSTTPVTVRAVPGLERLPLETELTAYVAGCGAVASALGRGATGVSVDLARTRDTLRLTVGDDGGPADGTHPADLQGAADTVVAAGGGFRHTAAPGGTGMVLEMTLPLTAQEPPP